MYVFGELIKSLSILFLIIYKSECSTHFSRRSGISRRSINALDEADEDISPHRSGLYGDDVIVGDGKIASLTSPKEVNKDNREKASRYSKRWRRYQSRINIQESSNSMHFYNIPTYSGTNVSSSMEDDDDNDSTVTDTDDRVLSSLDHRTSFVAECNMPTDLGVFKMRSYNYQSPRMNLEPIVLVNGNVHGKENVLVRVHDQCFTSEVFGSKRCDCRDQLTASMNMIQKEEGIVVYLQQEGRGIGIANKIAAYSLQDRGADTVEANLQLGFPDEMREYLAVPDILLDMRIQSIRLITNNPFKIDQLKQLGVKVVDRVPIEIPPNKFNRQYLLSKRDRMRHFFSDDLFGHQPRFDSNSDESFFKEAALETTNNSSNGLKEPSKGEESAVEDTKEGLEAVQLPSVEYEFGRESVEAAIAAIREGKVVIVVDDADRENEGDFIMAAEKATPEAIGFIIRYSSGVLCISLESDRLDELKLPPMVVNNEDPKQTAYTVSVDYKYNTTTGISAADRALTFSKLCDPSVSHAEFHRPGHVFPLRYKPGGVLARAGHTEASLDLTRLAGLRRGGVLAEVVHDDGSLRRLPALQELAKEKGLVLTSVRDIIAYRLELERNQHQ